MEAANTYHIGGYVTDALTRQCACTVGRSYYTSQDILSIVLYVEFSGDNLAVFSSYIVTTKWTRQSSPAHLLLLITILQSTHLKSVPLFTQWLQSYCSIQQAAYISSKTTELISAIVLQGERVETYIALCHILHL